MATRAIHTVFTVGGENEYQAAVKRINAALKELNSEIELSKEKFAGQEDSYTALYTKQQQLQRMIEKQNELAQTYASRLKQVQDSTDALNGYSEELRDTLNQIQAAMHNTSETSVGYDDLAKEAKEVEEELRKVETQMGKMPPNLWNWKRGSTRRTLRWSGFPESLQTLIRWWMRRLLRWTVWRNPWRKRRRSLPARARLRRGHCTGSPRSITDS